MLKHIRNSVGRRDFLLIFDALALANNVAEDPVVPENYEKDPNDRPGEFAPPGNNVTCGLGSCPVRYRTRACAGK
jgi:hypothetical protein